MKAGARARAALEPLPPLLYEGLVHDALREDLGLGGDLTSEATIPLDMQTHAALVARESGVLAGLDIALAVFRALDPTVAVEMSCADGDALAAGQTIARLTGDARAALGAVRTALNLRAHLCGIASTTARYVAAVAGSRAMIVETRKTLPGLRALQKYAVRAGGGRNHRLRLDDAILIKDNHVALAGGIGPALERARARAGFLVKVELEVDSLAQLDEALAQRGLPDAILLDNFALDGLQQAVARTAGRVVLEASGGITLDTVAAVARTGVDIISVGALTHSVRALDIALEAAAPGL
ncbi:MAG: carboxylating nicotinate-nucleotide diphosphorylase [Vulcanimicrobiaceae bacterium]